MSDVLIGHSGPILTLTLNRPEKMNAITRGMYKLLADSLNAAAVDSNCVAVIIAANGDHFTAGNDIYDFINDPPLEQGSEVWQFIKAAHEFPKVLIAAVQGNAVGIGSTMVMHCDFVYAAPSTRFRMPFVNLGLVPEFGASYLFPKVVGQKIAAELLLQGREFSGEEAQKWQIINEVVEDPKARAHEIAVEISAQPPNALIQAKQLMKSADHEKLNLIMAAEGELFQKALTSEEAQTAFMNFLAKKG
ncbi:MAG: enoyl-CoA hydratase-related protein [Actinomycetota bacterium]|nr:enoyl-CoA hydratase-related protein [Actinomycetota bacterium]